MLDQRRVDHSLHGSGTVARLLDGGRRLLVRFDSSPVLRVLGVRDLERLPAIEVLVREHGAGETVEARDHGAGEAAEAPDPDDVPAHEPVTDEAVDAISGPCADPPVPTTPVQTGGAPSAVGFDARQALEALRIGVVPGTSLDQLTVGRRRELARVDGMLGCGTGLTVVSGGYGQGKTHLLELAAARALEQNWLVARATFDAVELPPSHPVRLYAALLRGMMYPDRAGSGLRPLLERIGDSELHLHGKRRHRWLSPALFATHRAAPALADEVLEFVSGQHRQDYRDLLEQLRRLGYHGEPAYALADWRTFGQVMAHLLGGIATWARDAGYGGLLVLLDEAEYLDQLPSTSRSMAHNVLRYLAMATLPDRELAFDPATVYRGGHRAHQRIGARYHSDQPLAVLAAFTPNPALDRVLDTMFSGPDHRLELSAIRGSDLQDLADGVSALVAVARPDAVLPPHLRRALRRAVADAHSLGTVEDPRQVARMAVEFWDIQRHEGDEAALLALVP